jgi:topoisomerase IV subunit B
VVNALSERLEVEVALGGQLYRQVFARGIPKSGLEQLGRTPNRRGTKVRFKPDAQIFGDKAKFNPQRLFKMARQGLSVRWGRDPLALRRGAAARHRGRAGG